jgi:ABC-type transport system substrate-binding protein
MLEPTFNGDAITSTHPTANWSQLDVPRIDAAMDRASTVASGRERNRAWAAINKLITAQAPGIPYVWDDSFELESRDVQGVMNGYTGAWDLSFSSLR